MQANLVRSIRGSAAGPLVQWGLLFSLVAFIIISSLPMAPSVQLIGRDNGIFAYTAEVIYDGGTVYEDAWDNKLPGVYYINVVAFALFGESAWAVWTIDVLFVSLAALAFWWLLYRVGFEPQVATLMAFLFALLARHPILSYDVNFTENYALLPQVMIFLLGYIFLQTPNVRLGLMIGVISSGAFLIRHTTVGVALAFVPALLLMRHPVITDRRRWLWLGAMIAGGLGGLSAMALHLYASGVLGAAINATFIAPVVFHQWAGADTASIPETVITTFTASVAPLVLLLVAVWWVPGVRAIIQRVRKPKITSALPIDGTLAVWALLTLLLDIVLVNITDRGYSHYYTTLIPALVLLCALGLQWQLDQAKKSSVTYARVVRRTSVMLAVNLLLLCLAVTAKMVISGEGKLLGPIQEHPTVAYIVANTTIDDPVLVWGASSEINFQSQRHSPTQFHYGYPLIVPDEITSEMVDEFMTDIRTNEPTLIIDTTMEDGERIPPLDSEIRQEWIAEGGRDDVKNLEPLFTFVAQHCVQVEHIDEVLIYQCD